MINATGTAFYPALANYLIQLPVLKFVMHVVKYQALMFKIQVRQFRLRYEYILNFAFFYILHTVSRGYNPPQG